MREQTNRYTQNLTGDSITIQMKDTIERMILGFKRYGWSMLLTLLSTILAAVLFWALTYQPIYEKQTIYTVTITGETAQDNLATMFLAGSFPELLNSQLNEIIQDEVELTDQDSYNLNIEVVNSVNMLRLSVQSSNPEIAERVMDVVSTRYPEYAAKDLGNVVISEIENVKQLTLVEDYEQLLILFLVGLCIGIVIDGLFLLLFTFRYKTIQSTKSMASLTTLRNYGVFPKLANETAKRKRNYRQQLISQDLFAQEMKASVLKLRLQKGEVVLFIASKPNEGVTTITKEIAKTLGNKDQKTLVLELVNGSGEDSKGQLLKKNSAISTFIKKEESYDHLCLSLHEFEKACIEDQEGMKQLSGLLGRLKSEYSHILLDSVSLESLQCLPQLAKLVDQTIFLVKQNSTEIKTVQHSLSLLEGNSFKLKGYLLNFSDLDGSYYGSYGKSNYDKYYGGLSNEVGQLPEQ